MSEDLRYRDHELGEALLELEVAELPDGFYEDLRRKLVAEQQRRRRRGRRRRVAAFGGSAAAAAAVAALAVVLALPERSPLAPQPALAAVVKQRVADAFASISSLRGEAVLVLAGDERQELRTSLVVTDAGDMRATTEQAGVRIETAYDAARGVRREVETYADGHVDAREIAGLAPGPPDAGSEELFLSPQLKAFVRSLLAADDPRVRETRYEGREAWFVDVPVASLVCRPVSPSCDVDGLDQPDRLSATVDLETGMPLRVVATRQGRFLFELRLRRLEVNVPVSRADLRLDFPDGVAVVRLGEGFRRVPLESAAAVVGYQPLVPAWLPAGFELAEVGVVPPNEGARLTNRTNPESTGVVSLAYRRGLDRIVVTTRLRGDAQAAWTDPFTPKVTPAEDFQWQSDRIVLDSGAFAGATAEVVVDPRTLPHLWALGDRLVLTVAGDLDRAKLRRIAESLTTTKEGP